MERGALRADLKAFDVQVWVNFACLLGHQGDERLLEVLDLSRIHLGRGVLQQALDHVQEDAGDLNAVAGCFGRPFLRLGLSSGVSVGHFAVLNIGSLGVIVIFVRGRREDLGEYGLVLLALFDDVAPRCSTVHGILARVELRDMVTCGTFSRVQYALAFRRASLSPARAAVAWYGNLRSRCGSVEDLLRGATTLALLSSFGCPLLLGEHVGSTGSFHVLQLG